MEQDNESADITPKPNRNAKGKNGKPTRAAGITTAVLLFIVGSLALLGWSRFELTAVRVILYTLASFGMSLGAFTLLDELTHKTKSNYPLALMGFVSFAFFMNASRLTDTNALRWLSIAFAILFGFGALISLIVQLNKDIRERPVLKSLVAALLIAGLVPLLAWLFERSVILSLIPFALIVTYNEYLMTTYLTKTIPQPQSDATVSEKGSSILASFRSLPRSLRSIRRPVYLILIIFSGTFYFTVTRQASQPCDFAIFYQAVAPAYFGILAIVIALAVLVIRRDTHQPITEHLRLPITGLVQMYVVFALVNVFGLLMGTQVSGYIFTTSMHFSEIMTSVDTALDVLRLLIIQFAVSAFPVGLLYLYAMIRDFLTPRVGHSNHF